MHGDSSEVIFELAFSGMQRGVWCCLWYVAHRRAADCVSDRGTRRVSVRKSVGNVELTASVCCTVQLWPRDTRTTFVQKRRLSGDRLVKTDTSVCWYLVTLCYRIWIAKQTNYFLDSAVYGRFNTDLFFPHTNTKKQPLTLCITLPKKKILSHRKWFNTCLTSPTRWKKNETMPSSFTVALFLKPAVAPMRMISIRSITSSNALNKERWRCTKNKSTLLIILSFFCLWYNPLYLFISKWSQQINVAS